MFKQLKILLGCYWRALKEIWKEVQTLERFNRQVDEMTRKFDKFNERKK